MRYICLTLFPEMIEKCLHNSVIGRAMEQGTIRLKTYDIRDYTRDKHGRVDDYTYGGGAGMLIQAQPVFDAYEAALKENYNESGTGTKKEKNNELGMPDKKKIRTIYVTPQGKPFTQKMAKELAGEETLVFLCGHYEGIDERVLEEIVTDRVSIGDYVLTGGELAVMVMIDAISRLVPGVLGNGESADEESFHNDLLEYPQYTRPEIWNGKKVPEVLLSGNKKEIEKWRLAQSVERTLRVRPDLYEKYISKQKVTEWLLKEKRNNIPLIENLRRGLCEILYNDGENLILYNFSAGLCMLYLSEEKQMDDFCEIIPAKTSQILINHMKDEGKPSKMMMKKVINACYTEKTPAKHRLKDIRIDEKYIEGDRFGESQCFSLYLSEKGVE